VEQAMVTYHYDDTVRSANSMPQKDLKVTQDETYPGGLCFITMDPESNFIIVEQLAQGRDQTTWVARMAPALLIPTYYLKRVAQPRTISDGARLRALLFEPGGGLSALSPAAQDQLHDEAKRLAAVFQRSSSNVEGRNGYLSLRHHQLRGLDLPRKRECFTAIHNFFLTRPDGTTAAERFFGQKPRSMFEAILKSVELPPAPLSPPRRT